MVLKLRTTVEVKPDASVVNHGTKTSNDAVPREVSAESMATDQVRRVYSMIYLIDACLYSEAEFKAAALAFLNEIEDEFPSEGQQENLDVDDFIAAEEGFEEDRANDDIPVMQYEEQKENGEVIDLVKEENVSEWDDFIEAENLEDDINYDIPFIYSISNEGFNPATGSPEEKTQNQK